MKLHGRAYCAGQGTGREQEAGDRQGTGRLQTGDGQGTGREQAEYRQATGRRRQAGEKHETGDRGQETGGRRPEAGDRGQETDRQ